LHAIRFRAVSATEAAAAAVAAYAIDLDLSCLDLMDSDNGFIDLVLKRPWPRVAR
jgi:hypothetical protein